MTWVKQGKWYVFKYQAYPGAKRHWCIQTFGDDAWYDRWHCYDGTFLFKNESDAIMFVLRWA
jgi:hypothetical protein